jgi:V-type H+-transporting ATPase subunit H
LSPPEVSLLQSAEENPLEYTLAEPDDAVSYLRILLKMLDQVSTATTNTTAIPSTALLSSSSMQQQQHHQQLQQHNNTHAERILTLDTPVFSEDEAFDLYYKSTNKHYKRLVVAHYCVTKIYEILCVSLDNNNTTTCGGIPSVSELFYGRENCGPKTYHTNSYNEEENDPGDNANGNFHRTIHLEQDDWRPLLKILYNRSSDEYTKRGSALILAYILKANCERRNNNNNNNNSRQKTKLPSSAAAAQFKEDEDLLSLFSSEEHDTTFSPSSDNNNNNNNTPNKADEEEEEEDDDDTLQSLIAWLTSRLQRSGNYASLGVVTPTLGVLMSTTKQARLAFVRSGGIGYISRHLRAKRRQPLPYTYSKDSRTKGDSHHYTQNTQQTSVPIRQRIASPPHQKKVAGITNGFNNNNIGSSSSLQGQISQSNSFGSNVSSNLGLPEYLPSTEDVEETLGSIFSTASGAATAIARSATLNLESASNAFAMSSSLTLPRTNASTTTASSSSSVQQLYDLVFCLWCLSLDGSNDESVRRHFARDGAVPALAHLLKKVPREKVLRMTLACLRSLSTLGGGSSDNHAMNLSGKTITKGNSSSNSSNNHDEHSFVRNMIGCGVLKSLETVKQRRWNDADLEDDLVFLLELLANRTEELTQFSAYEAQIATGILQWDEMLHTHDFFRANARHMEGPKSDFAPLQRLVEVLYSNTTSGKLRNSGRADEISYVGLNEVNGWDEDDLRDDEICETLAVCLFDIGEFARNYPNGKAVLGNRCGIGAKALIMQYVHHPRDDVREQALLCASKLLIRNWKAIEN